MLVGGIMEFKDSRKREQIIKSIKLELKPVESTRRAIEDQGLLEMDIRLIENAKSLHRPIDEFTKEIIEAALMQFEYDFGLIKDLECIDYDGIHEAYMSAVNKVLPAPMKTLTDLLSTEFVAAVLPSYILKSEKFSESEKNQLISTINELKGFNAIVEPFLKNRITLLSDTVEKKLIENLKIYLVNAKNVSDILESPFAVEFSSEIDFLETIGNAGKYGDFLGYDTIVSYNKAIKGEYNQAGLVKPGINNLIYKLNKRISDEKRGGYYKELKCLYLQPLFENKTSFMYEKLEDDSQLRQTLFRLLDTYDLKKLNDIVEIMDRQDDFVINKKALNFISKLMFDNAEYIWNLAKSLKASEVYFISEVEALCNLTIMSFFKDELKRALVRIEVKDKALRKAEILSSAEIRANGKNTNIVNEYLAALSHFYALIICVNHEKCRFSSKADLDFHQMLELKIQSFDELYYLKNVIRVYLTRNLGKTVREFQIFLGSATRAKSKWLNLDVGEKFAKDMNTIMKMDGKYYFVIQSPLHIFKPFVPIYSKDERYVEFFNQKTSIHPKLAFPKALFTISGAREYFKETDADSFVIVENVDAPVIVKRAVFEAHENKLDTVAAVSKRLVTKEQCHEYMVQYISLCIEFAKHYAQWKRFAFEKLLEPSAYKDLASFYAHIATMMVDTRWDKVQKAQIDRLIDQGALLCFEITSKNMYDEGKYQSSYTRLFKEILSEQNIASNEVRLNSRPMMTYRPKSIEYYPTHLKNDRVLLKRLVNGEFISSNDYKSLSAHIRGNLDYSYLSKTAKQIVENKLYVTKEINTEIAKYKRFAEDKYFITFSYTKNAKIPENEKNLISEDINESMKNGYKILSLVAGHDNLLYYILFDENLEAIEEKSLNIIDGIDYSKKLKSLENDAEAEEAIKRLKKAYMGLAISKIVDVAVENNAVIVAADQTFESDKKGELLTKADRMNLDIALEKKLLDFYSKSRDGSISNPIQLTKGYKNALYRPSRQNGIYFRINGQFTDKIDSRNGFINLINVRSIGSNARKRQFLTSLDCVERVGNQLKISLDYKNMPEYFLYKGIDYKKLTKSNYTIFLGKENYVYNKDIGKYQYNDSPLYNLISGFEGKIDVGKLNAKEVNELIWGIIVSLST